MEKTFTAVVDRWLIVVSVVAIGYKILGSGYFYIAVPAVILYILASIGDANRKGAK